MFLAKKLDILIPIKNAIIEEIKIVARMINSSFSVSFKISEIAAAEPVLDFSIIYNAGKERDIVIKLVVPRRKRNCFLVVLINWEETNADWLAPMPGRKEQIGETKEVIIAGLIILRILFFIFSLYTFCWGIWVFWEIEKIKVEAPNKPERRGSNGWEIFKLNVARPRNPDKIKTKKAKNLELCSLDIKNIDIKTRIKDIILSIKGYIFGSRNINKGVIRTEKIIPYIQPKNV